MPTSRLNHVRGALAQLQAHQGNHPAVNQALEAVATSLSLVHTLSAHGGRPGRGTAASAAAASAAAAAAAAARAHAGDGAEARARTAGASAAGPRAAGRAAPHVEPAAVVPSERAAVEWSRAIRSRRRRVRRGPRVVMAHRSPPAMHAQPGMGGAPASPSMPVPAPPAGNLQLVNADLGAHSPTNFYKGLAGNDIIDHGGLFVSTYVLPKMGTPVRLKVSLPGGYEFEANAVVKWTREDGGADAPPGFGAQFTQITPEARQLVYRYVRNREPIFHDDF